MRISHNISAVNTYRQLSSNNAGSAKSLEKLSSGLRINKAADDAAGLAISEKMRGQIRGLDQAARNAQDGISLIQTAEGAMSETTSILQRMRELAVQSASDTNTDSDRAQMQKEVDQLSTEITRISTDTEFNTKKLLNGGAAVTSGTAGVTSAAAVTTATTGVGLGTIQGVTANGAVSTVLNTSSAPGSAAVWDTIMLNGGGFSPGASMVQFHGVTLNIMTDNSGDTTGTNSLITATTGKLNIDCSTTTAQFATAIANAFTAIKTFGGAGSNIADFTFSNSASAHLTITAGTSGTQYNSTQCDFIGLFNPSITPTTLGTAESPGQYSFTVDKAIEAVGASLTIGGQTFTAVASGAVGNQFNVGTDENTQALSIATAINNNGGLSTRYLATTNANQVILTEKAGKAIGVDLTTITMAGNDPTAGSYSFNITTPVAAGGKYTIDGTDITVTADAADAGIAAGTSVLYDATQNGTAAKLRTAINLNAALSAKYNAAVLTNTITLTQKAGHESTTAPVVSDTTASTQTSTPGGSNFLFQVGANAGQTVSLSINGVNAKALSVDTVDVSSQATANTAITTIDSAITTVSGERAKLGAVQNRLEHTVKNLSTTSENLTAAESRVRDVDMAGEMIRYTKNSILAQAATAMMAQANQAPQQVLQLLK